MGSGLRAFILLLFISSLANGEGEDAPTAVDNTKKAQTQFIPPPPAEPESDAQKEGLAEHNKLRKEAGYPELKMTNELRGIAIACATYYLNKGMIDHTCEHLRATAGGKKVGENLYMFTGKAEPDDKKYAKDAVQEWYKEKSNYKADKVTEGGVENYKDVGHYTQLIWKATTELGFDVQRNASTDKLVVVATYLPHGNCPMAYKENVPGSKGSIGLQQTGTVVGAALFAIFISTMKL